MLIHTNRRLTAQSMLEYLLVMVVVVSLVLGALGGIHTPLLNLVNNRAKDYFDTGSAAIMGGYYDGARYIEINPTPVNGEWCDYTDVLDGVQMRQCACPRPAFGGRPCVGSAVK
ncbi:MAG: hypothetical protein WCI27_03370 [Candidatus Omnitrophota bacterium]